MTKRFNFFCLALAVAATVALVSPVAVSAQAVGDIQVEVVNEGNSDFFLTPVWFGFHNGAFDSFDVGGTPSAGLEDIAEIGSAAIFNTEFAAAPGTPGDIQGSTVGGPIAPGATASGFVTPINPANYQFFNFASMLIASNDLFVGNDNPLAYQVFDASGNINDASGVFEIAFFEDSLYDAGTEVDDASLAGGAAFLAGAVGTDGVDEGGVITLATQADLDTFAGVNTVAGTTINDVTFGNGVRIGTIRVSIVSAVPEPSSAAVLGLGSLAMFFRRRRKN